MTQAPTASIDATIIAEWQVSRRERVRVSIEQFDGTWLVNIRRWFEADDGSIRPGKRGIALGIKHLPQLAEATTKALGVSRQRGLIESGGEDATMVGQP
jgi:hypothetical protein